MGIRVASLTAWALLSASVTADGGDALVLHYTFDETVGNVLHDKSGRGNDGRIRGHFQWVSDGVRALRFNGTDTYVECGSKPSLQLTRAGTLEVWCLAEAIQGGLISWHTGESWGDQRILLGFINYGLVYKDLVVALADGAWGTSFKEAHNPGRWAHFAVTFDGSHICLYRNGELLQRVGQDVVPVTKGVPMRLGLTDGSGDRYFKGRIAEVRIYNQALTAKQIAAHFQARAGAMDLGFSETVKIRPILRVKKNELRVEMDFAAVRAARAGQVAKVSLWNVDQLIWVAAKQAEIPDNSRVVRVTFSTKSLIPGDHELRVSVQDPSGVPVGIEAARKWYFPVRAQISSHQSGPRILNNLVVELLNKEELPAKAYQELTFSNPRRGWVFISTTAAVKGQAAVIVSVDSKKDRPVIALRAADPPTAETMRFLSAGRHTLRMWTDGAEGQPMPRIESVVVRSIPETMQCGYPAPSLAGYGQYDFKFLQKDVLPNITTHVGGLEQVGKEELKAWKLRGRSWLLEQNIPSLVNRSVPVTADVAYNWWVRSYGFQSAWADGLVADEFSEGDHPSYRGYIEAIKRIKADPTYQDKRLYAWCASRTMHTVEALSKRFVETLVATGCKIASEAYLTEPKDERAARELLDNRIGRQMRLWQAAFPSVMEQMIHVVGYMSAPPETLNVNPQVDLKVFLDMQFNYLANQPDCFGLYGVMVYKSRYADEETVRWAGRLFRHYCIEGNTDLLSNRYGFKYTLDHIRNADFDDGLNGWTTEAAEAGSITTGRMIGLGRMQGRVAAGVGNHFLLTKRCQSGPNRISQAVKDLTPGKLYSMKMIVADYQDWISGHSQRKELAVSIDLADADLLKQKCFMMPNHGFIRLGPFAKKGGGVPWHNYHSLVFRAKETTAELTISDWADAREPGGPVGQQLMFNFIEIQPYFDR